MFSISDLLLEKFELMLTALGLENIPLPILLALYWNGGRSKNLEGEQMFSISDLELGLKNIPLLIPLAL